MQAGEAWIFDNWREHSVKNNSAIHRIHLVIDTVGTAKFWQLARCGWDPRSNKNNWEESVSKVSFNVEESPTLAFEQHNILVVRSPDEVDNMIAEFVSEISHVEKGNSINYREINLLLQQFCQDWRGHWALYGDANEAVEHYQLLVSNLKDKVEAKLSGITLSSNRIPAYGVLQNWLDQATNRNVEEKAKNEQFRDEVSDSRKNKTTPLYQGKIPSFNSPIFIVAAPRSGSTMLFEALKNNKDLWSIGDDATNEIESVSCLHPKSKNYESNTLGESDWSEEVGSKIVDGFMLRMQNSRCERYLDMVRERQPDSIRFIDKH